MRKRIFISIFGVGVIVLIACIIVFTFINRNDIRNQIYDDMEHAVKMVSGSSPNNQLNPSLLFKSVEEFSEDKYVTYIDMETHMVYDSQLPDSALRYEEMLECSEVAEALESGSGKSQRGSLFDGEPYYFYAEKLPNGNILRLGAYNSITYFPKNKLMFVSVLLFIVLVISLLLAKIFTDGILRPFKKLSTALNDDDLDYIKAKKYSELEPLFDKIYYQQKELKAAYKSELRDRNNLASMISNMEEGVILLDSEDKIVLMNKKANDFISSPVKADESIGCHISEVCKNSEILTCANELSENDVSFGNRVLHIHFESVILNESPVGKVGLIYDVTERKEMEKLQRDFTSDISHELKTPLTSISGYAEIIETGLAQGEEIKYFAGKITKESRRMQVLIGDIIKLSQYDLMNIRETTMIDLNDSCKEAIDRVSELAAISKINLSYNGQSVYVEASQREITEAVFNLADNAIRYTPEGGTVTVSIKLKDSGCCITVADNGIGIPAEHIPQIFDRFYRVDKSRSKETGGTGLGLAIVKGIADRNGAKVRVESRPGHGSTFSLTFASCSRDYQPD